MGQGHSFVSGGGAGGGSSYASGSAGGGAWGGAYGGAMAQEEQQGELAVSCMGLSCVHGKMGDAQEERVIREIESCRCSRDEPFSLSGVPNHLHLISHTPL